MSRAIPGRDPEGVRALAECLLSVLSDEPEPSPVKVAAAHILAFGLVDLRMAALAFKGD